MAIDRSFCTFILSHGRPEKVVTARTLVRQGYTGPWYIVLDNEDLSRDEYIRLYGADRILVFDKQAIAKTFDTADLSNDLRTVVCARNACFEFARQLGYEYHLQLDDDYSYFGFRYVTDGTMHVAMATGMLDELFTTMLDFLDATGAAAVALGQGGDYIGGDNDRWKAKVLRKAMNTFFVRSDADWRFVGRMNEDVNAYTLLSHQGRLFLTTLYAAVNQQTTQANDGGMTWVYKAGGTYIKSFYSVMMCPSAVRIGVIKDHFERIHHRVSWVNCAPMILPETTRKPRPQPSSPTHQAPAPLLTSGTDRQREESDGPHDL